MNEKTTSEKKIIDELKAVVASVIKMPVESILDDKNIAFYGIDSLKFLLLLQRINTKFNIKLTIEDLADTTSVHSLAQIIKKLI